MEARNPVLASKIEWKTNEGGDIKVQDLIALSWIPLNLVEGISDDSGKTVEKVSNYKLYSSKGSCLKQFDRLMSSPDVTMGSSADYRAELKNPEVISAFKIAVQLPELYDYVYEKFPDLYNATGGLYGRINAVKKLNEKRKEFKHHSQVSR